MSSSSFVIFCCFRAIDFFAQISEQRRTQEDYAENPQQMFG